MEQSNFRACRSPFKVFPLRKVAASPVAKLLRARRSPSRVAGIAHCTTHGKLPASRLKPGPWKMNWDSPWCNPVTPFPYLGCCDDPSKSVQRFIGSIRKTPWSASKKFKSDLLPNSNGIQGLASLYNQKDNGEGRPNRTLGQPKKRYTESETIQYI